jgi:hypothetical protein
MCLSSNRDSESSSHCSHFTSQSYHGGIDNTSSHLVSSRLVKQLTKHSLYPFLKSDPSPHLPARVSSAFHIHEPMRTDNHRQPWGVAAIQPSSHPPSLSDDLSSVCVCLSAQPYRNAPAWNLQLQLHCSPALRCKAQVV